MHSLMFSKLLTMNSFIVVLLAIFAIAHGKSITAQESVQIQVYYESLCPDSIAFITTQLYPTFVSLGSDKVILELIPWGRASEEVVNGTKNFTCEHGPDECYGNKIHACAIDLGTIEQSTEFVFCSERSDAPADNVNLQECADVVGIAWTDLQECISSGKADELLSANGEKTNLAQIDFIPTIILDGTFSQEYQDESLLYFKTLLCTLLGFPDQCKC